MFTGLVIGKGVIVRIKEHGGDSTLTIRPKFTFESPLIRGESISVSGVCLTVTEIIDKNTSFEAFASRQTLEVTTLKDQREVNLERALRPTDRLGGHLVSGHVDEVGTLVSLSQSGKSTIHSYQFSPNLLAFIAPKGSIAIDGVSLTINDVDVEKRLFTVNLIPETLGQTTLKALKVGAKVNLEADLLAKYAVNYLKILGINKEKSKGLSLEKLALLGY